MLCKFTGGGPENGTKQEIADDVLEVRCTGLTPGYSEIYARDPKKPARFIYKGQESNGPYVPGFDDKYATPDWITNIDGSYIDLTTLQEVRPEK